MRLLFYAQYAFLKLETHYLKTWMLTIRLNSIQRSSSYITENTLRLL